MNKFDKLLEDKQKNARVQNFEWAMNQDEEAEINNLIASLDEIQDELLYASESNKKDSKDIGISGDDSRKSKSSYYESAHDLNELDDIKLRKTPIKEVNVMDMDHNDLVIPSQKKRKSTIKKLSPGAIL